MVQALALSNDIFFYEVGGGYPVTKFRGLGSAGLAKWSRLFGYGAPTGIDIPGEISATVPTAQWKRQRFAESWTTGDSYNMAIGQGYMLATPLQVLVGALCVLINGLDGMDVMVIAYVAPALAAKPRISPRSAGRSPSNRTRRKTWARCAPRAMRMPISGTRCVTR